MIGKSSFVSIAEESLGDYMAKYIDADELVKDIKSRFCDGCYNDNDPMKCFMCSTRERFVEIINAPTADVEEVRHGEWIKNNILCSNCNEVNPTLRLTVENEYEGLWLRRCPNCGAIMDGKTEINNTRCNKCINETRCSRHRVDCPDYKRDAPDGGYYG